MGELKIINDNKLLRHISGNFKILHLLSWATVGAYYPFIVVYLMDRNISTAQIGVILMLNSIATLIGQPLWGMVSDKIRSIKKVYLSCIFIASIFILLFPFIKSHFMIFILMPVSSLFFCCVSPLLDSWTIFSIKKSGKSYGGLRLWGSIGYSIVVIIVGKLISITYVNVLFIIYAILCLITLFTCATLFEYKDQETPDKKTFSIKELNIGRLINNYYYVTFVIFSCILFMTLSSVYNFLPSLIKKVGGNDETYGIATAVSAFSEAPILLISSWLIRKYKPQVLMLTGIMVYVIRLFVYSIAWSPGIVIFLQAFNGLSYSLFLAGSIYYIDSLAPEELKATAQTMATAVYGGLGGIVGNYVTGMMISEYGVFFVFRVGAIVNLAVFVLFLLSLYIGGRVLKLKPISDI